MSKIRLSRHTFQLPMDCECTIVYHCEIFASPLDTTQTLIKSNEKKIRNLPIY